MEEFKSQQREVYGIPFYNGLQKALKPLTFNGKVNIIPYNEIIFGAFWVLFSRENSSQIGGFASRPLFYDKAL